MGNQISIKVNIADRIYPLRVEEEEEERIRKAADLINKKMSIYVEQYSIKDKLAALSMCVLEVMTEYLTLEEQSQQEREKLKNHLMDIERALESVS
ncbi:MAG TPA: cell division protein ZapA [Bacteroidia bacterium]|nr:cell division protein ZapA [Sphingobacteriales bacterium]HPD65606.1 cell division protein ZapA [Bacteroidia bacterium]HRS59054.1 cell division protein ZapA [Bacteroidia bacterium]HRU69282.1 cell division protein ZapA [Bacteroidia bacterium]